MSARTITFGPFLLDPDQGTLFRGGELVPLGQKAALLLAALVTNPGQVRTKAELMDAAWPGTTVEESNLSVQIASLRKLLGPLPGGGEWIATIPRVGYRFVSQPEAATATPEARSEPVIPSLAVLPFQNMSGDPE
jgi:DNA-binding winged helix-turn-helix (wHTH) protein